MTGSTLRPSCSGRMPRIHWLIATRFQAAVPVSQEFFASPCVGASRPAIVWAYTYGSQRWTSELLAGAGVDPQVVLSAASPSPAIASAIISQGFVWQNTLAFSLYPGGYEVISPSSIR